MKTSTLVERLGAHVETDVPGVDVRETILGHVVSGGGCARHSLNADGRRPAMC